MLYSLTAQMHMIEQNNHTNQYLDVIGKQLIRVEERIENKVILQLGNQAKPILNLKETPSQATCNKANQPQD